MRWILPLVLSAASTVLARPPVILVDGYHLLCDSSDLSSTHDFGELQARLEAQGLQVRFLGSCSAGGKPPIETLGDALGKLIRDLNAPEVDIVSHSMGGLVVRSYLSGKQITSGSFTPPAQPRVRKWVSIATPNFGALIPPAIATFLPDVQARELVPGSQFLFDLATWNQNRDDLRGIDTLALIGNAGGFGPLGGSSDGTVAVTSASLSFIEPDARTRVVPYCHGSGDLTSILGLGCDGPPIAKLQADNPLSWQAIDSFLSGTDAWQAVGHSPAQDPVLSRYGGILSRAVDNMGNASGSIRDQNFLTDVPAMGTYTVRIDKPGPRIDLIAPSAARLPFLSLAPRMLISIYGTNLSGSNVTVNGEMLSLNYAGDRQLNALLPAGITGLAQLTVSNSQGRQTLNIFAESAVPAVFTAGATGTGNAAAIRSGNFLSLYLTGLGQGSATPAVFVDGAPVPVTYAGSAPGFPGLDQINIEFAPSPVAKVAVVVAAGRASNAVLIR